MIIISSIRYQSFVKLLQLFWYTKNYCAQIFGDDIIEEFHGFVTSKSLASINRTISTNSVSTVGLNKWVYLLDMYGKHLRLSWVVYSSSVGVI